MITISLKREKCFAIEYDKIASTAKGFKTMASFDLLIRVQKDEMCSIYWKNVQLIALRFY